MVLDPETCFFEILLNIIQIWPSYSLAHPLICCSDMQHFFASRALSLHFSPCHTYLSLCVAPRQHRWTCALSRTPWILYFFLVTAANFLPFTERTAQHPKLHWEIHTPKNGLALSRQKSRVLGLHLKWTADAHHNADSFSIFPININCGTGSRGVWYIPISQRYWVKTQTKSTARSGSWGAQPSERIRYLSRFCYKENAMMPPFSFHSLLHVLLQVAGPK